MVLDVLQVVYWDAYDGSAIRELEGLLTGSINAMDISQSGSHFVTGTGLTGLICIYLHLIIYSQIFPFLPFCFLMITGGDDNLVKVWDYMEGVVTHVGKAHGGSITSVKLCSNSSTLISTSADGAIVLWRFPHFPAS